MLLSYCCSPRAPSPQKLGLHILGVDGGDKTFGLVWGEALAAIGIPPAYSTYSTLCRSRVSLDIKWSN